MSVAAIARKLGRSPGTVINWVRDVPVIGATAGPGPRSAGQVRVKRVLDREEKLELQALVDSQDAERAVDLYRGGMSMLKTAVEVGRSEEWVKARLVEEGVFRG